MCRCRRWRPTLPDTARSMSAPSATKIEHRCEAAGTSPRSPRTARRRRSEENSALRSAPRPRLDVAGSGEPAVARNLAGNFAGNLADKPERRGRPRVARARKRDVPQRARRPGARPGLNSNGAHAEPLSSPGSNPRSNPRPANGTPAAHRFGPDLTTISPPDDTNTLGEDFVPSLANCGGGRLSITEQTTNTPESVAPSRRSRGLDPLVVGFRRCAPGIGGSRRGGGIRSDG